MAISKSDINKALGLLLEEFKEEGKIASDVELTRQQTDAITSILCGNDTLALLPTGAGKSWIYLFLPGVVAALRCMGYLNLPEKVVIPVISPLNALMQDQVKTARSLDMTATKLEDCVLSNLMQGQYTFVFGSPESWLENKTYRDILSCQSFYKNCVVIVVDEVHKVTW